MATHRREVAPRGKKAGTADLEESWFGIEPNVPVMHQVVTAQLAARRAGTQTTMTRAEVRGGGAKPWRQKGTGRARQGSIRAPHWRGGGVALGPKPRNYAQRTPKKMIRLALRSALSDRAGRGQGRSSSTTGASTSPSTKDAARRPRRALELEGKVLVVLGDDDVAALKSFRNLPGVQTIRSRRAQRLRRAGQRLGRLHRGHAARGRARRGARPGRRARGRTTEEEG